jgi:hypothetical protein
MSKDISHAHFTFAYKLKDMKRIKKTCWWRISFLKIDLQIRFFNYSNEELETSLFSTYDRQELLLILTL